MKSFAQALTPYYHRLGSMPLAVVLLLVLSIASVIGTVLLQNQEQADYLHQYGPVWYWTFRSLGLFDMYHTWWFLTLLGFLMASLSACLIRNVPRMLKDMRARKVSIADKSLQNFHHKHEWTSAETNLDMLQAATETVLREWELKSTKEEERTYIRADKRRYHKWGYILVHTAILVILIGGWMSVQFGFRGNMAVVEGAMENEISFLKGTDTEYLEMPFEVRCNDFFIDFYPTGMPKEFRSNLTIIDEGKEVLTSDIIVNEPLYYKGVYLYQSSFGDGGSRLKFRLFPFDDGKIRSIETAVYKTWTDPKTGTSLEITDFKPFNVENMANPGQPKKFKDLGPAVEYIIRVPGQDPMKIKSFMNPFEFDGHNQGMLMLVSTTGDARDYKTLALGLDFTNPKEWQLYNAFLRRIRTADTSDKKANFEAFKAAINEVFGDARPADFQDLGMRTLQAISKLPTIPWAFIPIPESFEQKYYTGLQVTRDPGVNVVWIGSAILVFGLCIMFYMPHRKLWVVLKPEKGKTHITLGGMTNSNRLAFEHSFNEIVTRLGDAFGQSPEQRGKV